MKTLLQINIEVNSGSTGRIAEQIGGLVLDKGWNSYITYARNYNPSKSKTIKIGNRWNIYLHVLQTRLFGNHLRASTRATRKLIKQISEINPDIIHLHQLHGYFLNVEELFSYLATLKIPIVWTLHDCWPFTGHCTYFSWVNCNKWRTECYDCPQINRYPKSYVDKSTQNFYLKKKLFTSVPNLYLVTVSEWLFHLTKQSFLKEIPVVTIQNGVDTRVFYPRDETLSVRKKYSIPQQPVIIGVGTTWTASKGFYDYIALRKVLDPNISIVLIGVSRNLQKKLPPGIVAIPRTESVDELAQLYSLADIVISLSYQESFGLTPIEGFACGTPAIVYNATALPELINSNVGYTAEPGNVKQVAEFIVKLLDKGKSFYTPNCLQHAENFDIRKKYEQYFSLYEKLLSR